MHKNSSGLVTPPENNVIFCGNIESSQTNVNNGIIYGLNYKIQSIQCHTKHKILMYIIVVTIIIAIVCVLVYIFLHKK